MGNWAAIIAAQIKKEPYLKKKELKSQSKFDCPPVSLFHKFHYFCKHRWLVFGEVGEDFSVEQDIFAFQCGNQAAVTHIASAARGVYFNVPKAAEHPFLFFAALEHPRPGVQKRFFGGSFFRFSAPEEALGMLQQAFSFLMGDFSSFDARHKFRI